MSNPVIGDVELELAANLRVAIGRLSRALQRTNAGADLTSTQLSVLARTVRSGAITLSQLASDEGINPTMLSRVVRHLEDAGHVVRRVDPNDKRAGVLDPTARGRRLHDRIRTERTDALNSVLGDLEPEERSRIVEVIPTLEHVAHSLKTRRP